MKKYSKPTIFVNDEDSDEFFEGLDDEGEKDIFDSDLANDNMDNDDDIIE